MALHRRDHGVRGAHMKHLVGKPCAGDVAAQPAAGNVGDCGACASDSSRINAWLERMEMPTLICALGEGENEDQAAPSSAQTSPTVVACFERYESIDDIRPNSEPGIETQDPLGGDGQRVANSIRNTVDESTNIALGWQEQSWAMSWDEIFLDRQAEGGRNWDSKIATRWRARLAAPSGQAPRGQTVSLRQIYMDKHAELRDVDIVSAMNVVSGLKHPNISAIIGALLHQGDFYIVSEFCAEGSLQDLIVETHAQKSSIKGALGFSTMLTDKSVAWISGILQAVEYLHYSIEVCHGKITASNVLVSDDRSSCKLCDCHINENLIQDIMVISPTSADGFSDGTGKAADLFDVGLIAWQIGAGKLVECEWAEKPSQFKGAKKLEAAWVPMTELTVAGCKDKHMRRMFRLCSGISGVCSATEALDKIVDGKVIKTEGQSTFASRYRVASRLPGMGIISRSTSHTTQSETYSNSVHGSEVPAILSREESVVSDTVETVVSGSSTRLVPAAEKRTLLMPPKSESAEQLGKHPVIHVNNNAADLGVPNPSGVSPEFQTSQTILDQNGSSFLRRRSRFNTMSDASTFPTTGAQTFVPTPQTLSRSFSLQSSSFRSRKSQNSPKVLGGRRCSNSGEWAPEDLNTQEVEDQESQASNREGKKRPPRMTALFQAFSNSFSSKSATVSPKSATVSPKSKTIQAFSNSFSSKSATVSPKSATVQHS